MMQGPPPGLWSTTPADVRRCVDEQQQQQQQQQASSFQPDVVAGGLPRSASSRMHQAQSTTLSSSLLPLPTAFSPPRPARMLTGLQVLEIEC